jgi:hypothetical protein
MKQGLIYILKRCIFLEGVTFSDFAVRQKYDPFQLHPQHVEN